MCLLVEDKYTESIEKLDEDLEKNAIITWIREEYVLDVINRVKESEPPKPDLHDPKVFKFYFTNKNREYK